MKNFIVILSVASLIIVRSFAQGLSSNEVGVDEKLGNYIPEDLWFIESTGDAFSIKQIIDKPTLLALVYYECPSICNPMLMNLGMILEKVSMKHGEDFQVVTISFSPYENYSHAKKWKNQFYSGFKKQIPGHAWRFFVGDTSSIRRLTDAVGFKFIETEDRNFVHSAAYIAISPQRKITRYLYGTRILPFDIKMAMIEAREGRETPAINRVLEYCFSYDPEGRTYAFNFTKVFGTMIIFFSIIILSFMFLYEKKRNKESINDKR